MAIIVTVLGLILTLPFQIFIREKPSVALKKLKWYKWLVNPKFYLVKISPEIDGWSKLKFVAIHCRLC